MDKSISPTSWTREAVELRLVAAFRLMPSCPVFSAGGRLSAAAAAGPTALSEVLAWAALLDADARVYLWTWARCRATRASFAEYCRNMGWARSSAEDGRRRGAAAIAAALNAGVDMATATSLDRRSASIGASMGTAAGSAPRRCLAPLRMPGPSS